MGKLLVTGVDGNLGGKAAEILLTLVDKDQVIFCGYSEDSLKKYADMGIETHITNFNHSDGLSEAFKGADKIALISMPFVGEKRQKAHKNAVDAAKAAGVKQIIYTSLVNAADETNPSTERLDHIYTEKYIESQGLDYIFLRNSNYAEAWITNYFEAVKNGGVLINSLGAGKMAWISREDCAKAVAHALVKGDEYHKTIFDINGAELMTINDFLECGNKVTGNHVTYKDITEEENYKIYDEMGIPRTTDGVFQENSSMPYSSEGMVTFSKAIRLGKFDVYTKDFKKLTGDEPMTITYLFEHWESYLNGARHSKDD